MRYLLSILLLCCAALARADAPPIAAKAWLLTDYHSGAVLAQRNADQPLEPASLTKLMTAYLVFEALREGKLYLKQRPIFSVRAYQAGGARLPLDPKEPATVHELLQGMIVFSANDAAIQLAEAVAGREDAFVARMNETAKRLGLSRTRYLNPTGQPQPGHVSTARDVATLSARLIRDFPEYYPRYKQKTFEWRGAERTSHNRLLWRDPTVDGLKTGTTASAGFCLAASARREVGGLERRVIAVVLGAGSEEARAVEAQKLLNYGMSAFDTPRLYGAGQRLATLPVWLGVGSQVSIRTDRDLYVTIPAGDRRLLKAEVRVRQPLTAPIRQNQSLGKVVITLRGRPVAEVPALAETAVESAGWASRMLDRIKLWWGRS